LAWGIGLPWGLGFVSFSILTIFMEDVEGCGLLDEVEGCGLKGSWLDVEGCGLREAGGTDDAIS